MKDRRVCPKCRKSGFKALIGFDRPRFQCSGCDYTWSCGHNGGGFFENASNTIDKPIADFREHTPRDYL